MLFAMTASAEPIVIQRYWNLVDLLIRWLDLEGTASALVHLCGALICIIVPYLLGSINPAILISKTVYHEDIREFGSGNAGTTNMLRTYGKKAAIATFALDLAKAAVAVILGKLIWESDGGALAGFFVMFGHMFPIYYRFRGGKGVACLAMVILTLSPITFLILLAIFLIIAIGTRYISLASVMCALLYPLLLRAFANDGLNVAMAVMSTVFVVYMHRENLKRLWAGQESKVDFSKISKKKKGSSKDSPKGDDE